MPSLKEVFDTTKVDVKNLLNNYELITDQRLNELETIPKLYLGDERLNSSLNSLKERLESYFTDVNKDNKRYGFKKIVKYINPDYPVGAYSISVQIKFKYIRSADKVALHLDEEFEVWANSYKKETKEKLLKNGNDEYATNNITQINSKIDGKRKLLEYLKNNIDKIDIRIISKKRAKEYGTIHILVDGKQRKMHLSKKLPNIIYFDPSALRKNNEVDIYLSNAKNAFGDVFFLEETMKE